MLAMAVLYWAAPAVDLPFRLISRGSIFFTLGWLVASFLFGLYVANFGSFNSTYGTLGAVVIALLWAYITGFLLLLGAEIDALEYQRKNRLAEVATQNGETPAALARKKLPNAWLVGLATMVVAVMLVTWRRWTNGAADEADNGS